MKSVLEFVFHQLLTEDKNVDVSLANKGASHHETERELTEKYFFPLTYRKLPSNRWYEQSFTNF